MKLIVDTLHSPLSCVDFEKFPAHSIALDGYVAEAPFEDLCKPIANFNHHENCHRIATRSTCAQVLMAIRQGLFDTFDYNKTSVYINDCDEDVCLSWFLLKNHYLVGDSMSPLTNRLVSMEDMLDSTAGAYRFPKDIPVLEELNWIFAPYRNFRVSGKIDSRNDKEYGQIIDEVCDRIKQHICPMAGEIKRLPLDTRYDLLHRGNGWSLVKEVGGNAKTGIYSDGIKVFCNVRERPDGRFNYVIGKFSAYVKKDLLKIFELLNIKEFEVSGSSEDRWGGSMTIGGSPRVNGSMLTPDIVSAIIEEN